MKHTLPAILSALLAAICLSTAPGTGYAKSAALPPSQRLAPQEVAIVVGAMMIVMDQNLTCAGVVALFNSAMEDIPEGAPGVLLAIRSDDPARMSAGYAALATSRLYADGECRE